MFNDDDLIPRTYSIKGYKKRKTIGFKRVLLYLSLFIVFLFAMGIVVLTAANLI